MCQLQRVQLLLPARLSCQTVRAHTWGSSRACPPWPARARGRALAQRALAQSSRRSTKRKVPSAEQSGSYISARASTSSSLSSSISSDTCGLAQGLGTLLHVVGDINSDVGCLWVPMHSATAGMPGLLRVDPRHWSAGLVSA